MTSESLTMAIFSGIAGACHSRAEWVCGTWDRVRIEIPTVVRTLLVLGLSLWAERANCVVGCQGGILLEMQISREMFKYLIILSTSAIIL